ncbi:MAG: methyltransferase domain-containing protein [Chloroflexota bacterium]
MSFPPGSTLMRRIMRAVFYLLYHPFAFTYDLIAATVSLGRWKDWVYSIIPFIEGTRLLELGHGPGHLQRILRDHGLATVGLDESAPMGTLAKERLRKSGHSNINLVRAISQNLPFPDRSFQTVVSTFPSEYIFDPRTLVEVRRCLFDGGRLVVLPVAWHVGQKVVERFLAWLFHFTGESPRLDEVILEHIWRPIEQAGFQVEIKKIEVKSSLLLIIIAVK